MRIVSTEERRARLARRHRLAEPALDPVEASRAVVGLHATDPATVYLSARARVPGMAVADMEGALYEERTLVRILGMRRTMFVVPTSAAPVINQAATARLAPAQRKRQIDMVESAGIADDGARWVDQVAQSTLEALNRRGEATASELAEDVPQLREKITFYKKDGSVLGVAGMSTRMLFLLATEARVIRARPLGSWVSSLYRWSTTDRWLGGPLEDLDPDEAAAELTRAWLGSFGPGTELDLKWWTGWPVRHVRSTLQQVGAVEVEVETGTGYLLPDDLEEVPGPGPWVALLPSLDATVMGWKERNWYLGEHGPRVFDRNGNAGPTVWVDGRVVGGWAQRKDGNVVYEVFEDVGGEARSAIDAEAGRLEEWLGDTTVTARFRSPHDRELTASGDR